MKCISLIVVLCYFIFSLIGVFCMRKRSFVLSFIGSLSLTIVSITAVIFSSFYDKHIVNNGKASDVEYTLNLESLSTTNKVLQTIYGNDIYFNVKNFNDSVFNQNASFRNLTAISGIKSIAIVFNTTDKDLSISYGWEDNNYSVENEIINYNNPIYTFNNESPSFFKLSNENESSIEVDSILLTYSCKETDMPAERALSFTLSGDSEYYIVSACNPSIKAVSIPSIYNGLPVKQIGSNAFDGCSCLQTVNIPESIDAINYSFSNISTLENINVSSSNQKYSSISGVLFNKDATEILSFPPKHGDSYEIPNTVQTIKHDCFRNASSLSSINIPNTVASIEWGAFADCYSLTEIDLPNSIVSLGGVVFAGCTSLKKVVIPDGVESLDGGIFNGCTNLSTVVIPNSVISIEDSLFFACNGLIIYCKPLSKPSGWSDNWNSYNRTVIWGFDGEFYFNESFDYILESGKATIVGINDDNIDIIIPTVIDEYNVGKIVISSIISSPVFKDKTLRKFSVPESVEGVGDIPDNLFGGYFPNLQYFTIPKGVVSIGTSAFSDLNKLEYISIPDTVTTIKNKAFAYCQYLTSIFIPDSVVSMGSDVFSGCNLVIMCEDPIQPSSWNSNWNSNNNPVYWNTDGVLNYSDGFEYFIHSGEVIITGIRLNSIDIVVPATINGLPVSLITMNSITRAAAFKDATLRSFSIPNSVNSFGILPRSLFFNFLDLQLLTIPEGITRIESDFYQYSLRCITIPSSLKSIDSYIFYSENLENLDVFYRGTKSQWDSIDLDTGNDSLNTANIEYNSTVDTLLYVTKEKCNYILSNDNRVFSLEITDKSIQSFVFEQELPGLTITRILNIAFTNCSELNNLVIPDGVVSIGSSAFDWCSLTSVTIPNSVTSIGSSAFSTCQLLTSVTFTGTIDEWNSISLGDNAFFTDTTLTIHCTNGDIVLNQ